MTTFFTSFDNNTEQIRVIVTFKQFQPSQIFSTKYGSFLRESDSYKSKNYSIRKNEPA